MKRYEEKFIANLTAKVKHNDAMRECLSDMVDAFFNSRYPEVFIAKIGDQMHEARAILKQIDGKGK